MHAPVYLYYYVIANESITECIRGVRSGDGSAGFCDNKLNKQSSTFMFSFPASGINLEMLLFIMQHVLNLMFSMILPILLV